MRRLRYREAEMPSYTASKQRPRDSGGPITPKALLPSGELSGPFLSLTSALRPGKLWLIQVPQAAPTVCSTDSEAGSQSLELGSAANQL